MKKQALAKYLACEIDELEDSDEDSFKYGKQEYKVLDDSEADEKCETYIRDTLWAFNPNFLQAHLKNGIDAESLIPMQEKMCESCNEIIFNLIKDYDHFVEDAIKCDGHGLFLSYYDGEEIDLENNLFAYRVL